MTHIVVDSVSKLKARGKQQQQQCEAAVDCAFINGQSAAAVRFGNGLAVVSLATLKYVCEWELAATDTLVNAFAACDGLIWACQPDGQIRAFDWRAKQPAAQVETGLPVSCVTATADGRLLAFGTELMKHKAQAGPMKHQVQIAGQTAEDDDDDDEEERQTLVGFVDSRRPDKMLGVYSESHSDEVSCLRFAPDSRDLLLSGSLDGLMNVFDLRQASEYDALLHCLNTEASVNHVMWSPGSSSSNWSSVAALSWSIYIGDYHKSYTQIDGAGEDGQLDVFNGEADRVVRRQELDRTTDLDGSDDQRRAVGLFYADEDSVCTCWSRSEGRLELDRFGTASQQYSRGVLCTEARQADVRCAAFDSDGRLLLTGADNGQCLLYRLTFAAAAPGPDVGGRKQKRRSGKPY